MPRPVFVAIVAACLTVGCDRPPSPAPAPPPPTSGPATTQAVPVVAEVVPVDPPPAGVLDVVRRDRPDYPTTRPLDLPADPADAAKIVLDRPARVDGDGNLWLTHPAGVSLAEARGKPVRDHTVVTRDPIDLRATASDGPPSIPPGLGWPEKPVEAIPLADGGVLIVAIAPTDGNAFLKLIAGAEKPATGAQLRAIQPLARKLADRDPAQRQLAQRQLEAMGPSVLPMLESMRDQLPPEAQIRIEAMLGQRFAPTIAGLRLLPGGVRTLARFPGGGCVLRFPGGGTIDADGDTPARSVIPATVLIRPGYPIELIDPESVCDFLPGRQSIQWMGEELLISDAAVGPRRWVGNSLSKPILPKELADFDTVVAIDARRRWLLTSAKRPGKTLLIDPSLPDTTPKLPTWTLAGDAIGRTDAGWPAVRRGDRLFVLERGEWKVDKPAAMRPPKAPQREVSDEAGRKFSVEKTVVRGTDVDGRVITSAFGGDGSDATPVALSDKLLVYTPDGTVRRFDLGHEPLTINAVATFTQNVPRQATVWVDPAGRLVMANEKTMTVAFPGGFVPRELADLMLNPGR